MPRYWWHGDVAGVAPVGGRQQRVVAGRRSAPRTGTGSAAAGARPGRSTRSSASRACARGIAYSISVKRTRAARWRRPGSATVLRRRSAHAPRAISAVQARDRRAAGARPARQIGPSTPFSSSSSCSARCQRGVRRGLGVAAPACASAPCACTGRRRTRSGRCRPRARRGGRASRRAAAARRGGAGCRAGTHWIVTSETTPSAPSETRAAQQLVAAGDLDDVAGRRHEPHAATRAERLPKRAPVPCVAVASAPATVCASMSPWFSSAEARARRAAARARAA